MKKRYNTIFISGTNHYDGTPNHGLWQMFLYFKNVLKDNCAYFCTQNQKYNDEDSYDISYLGGKIPLYNQISLKLFNMNNPNTWEDFKIWNNYFIQDLPNTQNVDNILNALPEHNNIILGDKYDINEIVLSSILKRFKSKLILVTMVHDAHTGWCSYPTEHNCEKYKSEIGCVNCPETIKNIWEGIDRGESIDLSAYDKNTLHGFLIRPHMSFSIHKAFLENNIDNVILNAGSSYSLNQAAESYLYRNVKKELIPLKTVNKYSENLGYLLAKKKMIKQKILNNTLSKAFSEKEFSQNTNICLWSAFDPLSPRKGMKYFIDSLWILSEDEEFDVSNTVFVIAGVADKMKKVAQLLPEKVKVVCVGLLDRETLTNVILGSDLYCSTTIEDAGPRTIGEAVACGTPVVSFDRCIATDLVSDKNGKIVKTYDTMAYAHAIKDLLSMDQKQRDKMSEECLESFDCFYDDEKIVKKWKEVLA